MPPRTPCPSRANRSINSVSYVKRLMVPTGRTRTDEQIAQVLTYIGEQWQVGQTREARENRLRRKASADRQTNREHD